jgi:hypothetical protein
MVALNFSATLIIVLATLVATSQVAQASVPVNPSILINGPSVVATSGQVAAKLVPVPTIRPLDATGTDDQVTISIIGEGLHMDTWEVIGQPLPPGWCTFGVFHLNNNIVGYGPDLCNEGTEDAAYVSTWSDVTISGPAQVVGV